MRSRVFSRYGTVAAAVLLCAVAHAAPPAVYPAPAGDPDAATTKLIAAIRTSDAPAVSRLLAGGANANASDANQSTPLMQACAAASPAVVKLLLDHGADISARDKSGFTPLLVAAYAGHIESVRLLLDKGASPLDADKDGHTALMGAAYSGNDAVVRLLLDKSAPVPAADKDGFTALMVASGTGNVPLVQLLLDRGGDVNAPTRSGFTPLMQACGAGKLPVVALLLDHGANVNARAGKGASALLVAAYAGNAPIAGLLLDHGADANVSDSLGHTPLIGAAYAGNVVIARSLLDRGAKRDAQTKAGLDALMQAAYSGRLAVARLLLEQGAAVDSRTARGLTPLMQAVGAGNTPVARLLLEYGADVNAVDTSQQSPSAWAKKRGHEEMLPFLRTMGALPAGAGATPASSPPPSGAFAALGIAAPVVSAAPAIHGPRIVGASPDRPFLYRVPATGKEPLRFAASGLPAGLTLDATTGLITGKIAAAGTFPVTLSVSGAGAKATRSLRVVCAEHKIGLTPPLGWSAWNLYGDAVDFAKVRTQADALLHTGLAAHGYTYILLDDSWQGRRNSKTDALTPNARMANIKALADYLHTRGLKLGIYSSPNRETSGGYAGSEGHETQDAKTFAAWGVDYLKYDWTDNSRGRNDVPAETVTAAFAKMRVALDGTDRDIFYALTPYGFGGFTDWGQPPVRANSWWVTSDVIETWQAVSRVGSRLGAGVAESSPGRWNDGGWLLAGKVGSVALNPHFSRLTADEQKSQISLWSLAASPLILSNDLTNLDPNRLYPLTTALLTNDDVLDVDQDVLGVPAERVGQSGRAEIWARPLADGTVAVGVFNKGDSTATATVRFADLPQNATAPKRTGSQAVRDLWLRKDLGAVTDQYAVTVRPHGVALLKIGSARVAP